MKRVNMTPLARYQEKRNEEITPKGTRIEVQKEGPTRPAAGRVKQGLLPLRVRDRPRELRNNEEALAIML